MTARRKIAVLLLALATSLCGCAEKNAYKDGTYEGRGKGYNEKEPIVLRVVIEGGRISDIAVISHGESTEQVPQAESALEKLPGAMARKNTAMVDGIAGATETSAGLRAAVGDALQKAGQ